MAKLRPEQIGAAVKKQLLPIYLVFGEEALLAQEACDQIRFGARAAGFLERELYHNESGFDWNQVLQETANLGLFSTSMLIEIRMRHHSPGKPGSQTLISYCDNPCKDTILVISMDKLDKRMLDSRWCKAIDKAGAIIQIRPVGIAKLPEWITRRFKLKGKRIERDAAELIAERTEGNLLATQQEIEKICLLIMYQLYFY